MAWPAGFLTVDNFDLALERVQRSTHRDYKKFFRHHYAYYEVARISNIQTLVDSIRLGAYKPAAPDFIHFPKKSGKVLLSLSSCGKTFEVRWSIGCDGIVVTPDASIRSLFTSVFRWFRSSGDLLIGSYDWPGCVHAMFFTVYHDLGRDDV